MVRIFKYPWQSVAWAIQSDSTEHIPESLRPSNGAIAVLSEAAQPNFGLDQTFPQRHIKVLGQQWILCELPGPRVKGPEKIALPVQIGGGEGRHVYNEIPYLDAHEQFDAGDSGDIDSVLKGITPYEHFFDDILNMLQTGIDFIYKKNRGAKNTEARVKYWVDLYDELMTVEEKDKAKSSLITDLAEELPSHLQGIRRSPKKRLQRIRQNQRLHRIQELDKQCIIDYAQRPGITPAQKAGQRQRLLSVTRVESIDTLENRVALDFCRLARKAAMRYDRENSLIKHSPRLNRVQSFGRLCREISKEEKFLNVRRLTSPCRLPNHALLQSALYSKIWKAYQLLLVDFDVRNEVWRWPRRAWSDVVKIFVSFAALELEKMGLFSISERPYRKPIKLAKEQLAGCWFRHDPFPGPFIFGEDHKKNISLYIVDGEQIDNFLGCSFHFSICNADFYFAWVSGITNMVSVLPVWAMLGDSRWNDLSAQGGLAGELKTDLSVHLEMLNTAIKSAKVDVVHSRRIKLHGGFIMRGNWEARKEADFISEFPKSNGGKLPIWYLEINTDRKLWRAMLTQLATSLGDLLYGDL